MAELKSKVAVISGEMEKMRKAGVKDKAEVAKALSEAKAEFDALKKAEEERTSDKSGCQGGARLEARIGERRPKEIEERDRLQKEYGRQGQEESRGRRKSGGEA